MKIAFLGDMAFLGQYNKKESANVEKKLDYLRMQLQKYDYVVANLESPLTDKNSTLVCKSMHLKSDPINVELLKYLNISAVTLANNHITDFGTQGLKDTISLLEKYDIKWFGVNSQSLVLKDEMIRLSGFCCYSTNGTRYDKKNGINLLTYDNLEKQLSQDKQEGYFSVVIPHWGIEHTNYPAYEHICLMKKLLTKYDALVCGHHPHIIQGIQKINKSLVAYSLGNAIFDTCISKNGKLKVELNEDNRIGLLLSVSIEDGMFQGYEYQGFYISNEGILEYDVSEKLNDISNALENITDVQQYELMRKEQINKTMSSKFGRHDLKWLLTRMNYYAVGARITSGLRRKKYQREVGRYMNE